MNRNYWTIYDDDSMELEQELVGEELELESLVQQVLRRMKTAKEPRVVDHFEKESDLFEV